MKAKAKEQCDLHENIIYWVFHFSFHLFIGLVAAMAGLKLLFDGGNLVAAMALIAAAVFALVNSIAGFFTLYERRLKKTNKGINKSSGE